MPRRPKSIAPAGSTRLAWGTGFGSRRRLPLNHPDWPHPGDLLRDPRRVNHVHDVVHVLVRPGLLLREAAEALGAGDDAARLQLAVDPLAARELHRGGAAQGPAGPVAGGPNGLLH